jgi:hypothetical protein
MARRMNRDSTDKAAFVYNEHMAASRGVKRLYNRSVYWAVTQPWMAKYNQGVVKEITDAAMWNLLEAAHKVAHVGLYESWSIKVPVPGGGSFDVDSRTQFLPKAEHCNVPAGIKEYMDRVLPIFTAWAAVSNVTHQVLTKFTRAAACYYYPQLGMLMKVGGKCPDDMIQRAEGVRRVGDLVNPIGPQPIREVSGTLASAQLLPTIGPEAAQAFVTWRGQSPYELEMFTPECVTTNRATGTRYLEAKVFPLHNEND